MQLKRLAAINRLRREIADYYDGELLKIDGITPPARPAYGTCTYHRYTAVYDEKETGVPIETVFENMKEHGVSSGHTYLPIYLHGILKRRGYEAGICPRAEEFYKRSMMLPVYPGLTQELRRKVIGAVKDALVKK